MLLICPGVSSVTAAIAEKTVAKLESADPAAAGRLYEIRHNTDKGRGVFATADIAQGTLILCEKPLLTLGPEDRVTDQESLQACLEAKIKALSAEKQQEVYSFRNIKPLATPPLRYIFEGNALPCGPESKIGGLYSVACLFNHSCIYNTNVSWDEESENLTIYAIRPILAGEEITIRYKEDGPSESRRAGLKFPWVSTVYANSARYLHQNCDSAMRGVPRSNTSKRLLRLRTESWHQ